MQICSKQSQTGSQLKISQSKYLTYNFFLLRLKRKTSFKKVTQDPRDRGYVAFGNFYR
jgi:hypothetical protein